MAGRNALDIGPLAHSPLLDGIPQEQVEHLVELARRVPLSGDQIAVHQGSQGESLFLLYSGAIAITRCDDAGPEVVLASLCEPGSFFGEMSLVDPAPRSATVRSQGDAVLLELPLQVLEGFFARYPEARAKFLRNIARMLARRLRAVNVRLTAGKL